MIRVVRLIINIIRRGCHTLRTEDVVDAQQIEILVEGISIARAADIKGIGQAGIDYCAIGIRHWYVVEIATHQNTVWRLRHEACDSFEASLLAISFNEALRNERPIYS